MFRGYLQPALDPLEGNVEAARLSGNAQAICWSLYGLSQVALAVGEIERGMSAAQEALDVGDDGKPSHHVAYAALVLAQAHLLTARPDRGVALLERASGGPDLPLVADSWRAYFLELLTRCRLALGERDAAERAAADAIRLNRDGLLQRLGRHERAAPAAVQRRTLRDLPAATNFPRRRAGASVGWGHGEGVNSATGATR